MTLLKWFSALLVVILLGQQLGAGGCTTPGASFQGTFKVALVAPFSGQHSAVGYNMLFAAKLALKEWNESGRLKGYRVELIAQDDRNEAPLGLMQAKKMILDQDVMGVVGHPTNASALAAADAYNAAGLAMLSTEATADALSTSGYRSIFRLSANESVVLTETLRFLKQGMKAQNLAIVAEPTPEHIRFSERLYGMMRSDGMSLAFGEPLRPEQTEFSDIARRMAASVPRAVFFEGTYLSAGALVNEMRLQKMSSTFIVNTGSLNPLFMKVAGNSAEGAYLVSLAPNPTDIPAAGGFVQSYRALAGTDPLPSAVLTYDAVNLLLTAVERGLEEEPAPKRAAAIAQLQTMQGYPGLSSSITFDETGATTNREVYFYRIAGSRFPGERQETPN